MTPFPLLVMCLAASFSVPAAAIGVRDVPCPCPDGWVADEAGLLAPAQLDALDALGDRVQRRAGAELVVVTVESLAGRPAAPFARELFRVWALGDPPRQNGIMLFVAHRDRTAAIILGAGLDGTVESAAADQVMQDVIVPRFRAGAADAALLAGAEALVTRFFPLAAEGSGNPDAAPLEGAGFAAGRALPADIARVLDQQIAAIAAPGLTAAALPVDEARARPDRRPARGVDSALPGAPVRVALLARADTAIAPAPGLAPEPITNAGTWLYGAAAAGFAGLGWALRRRRVQAEQAAQRLARFAPPRLPLGVTAPAVS